MTNVANFNSLGNDFTVRFGLEDMSGRSKSSLFRALLADSGLLEGVTEGTDTEKFLTQVMTVLWNK